LPPPAAPAAPARPAAGLDKLQLLPLAAVFLSSAILGDAVNYAVGNRLGR
jgi:membrane protein DedA with SNARE-associated domain